MELEIKKLNKLLGQANNILISGPKDSNLDVLGAAYAWHIFLSSNKKKVDIAFDGKIAKYNFFPENINIDNSLGELNKFKIILDVSKTQVKQLSYDVRGDKLEIDIVPQDGLFSAQDVSTARGNYKYDLVITLGADSLDVLGNIFSENRDLFHSRPIVNIDNSVLNENYGELDIVEASATSVSEISYNILKKYLDKEMSTYLLAGMIFATSSFQSPKVTPYTLEIASNLIIKGAQREKIIDTLYRTKDISTLKSWGKVLSRIKKTGPLISSFLRHEEAEYLPESFEEMIKDLILSTPDAQVAIIFYQLELQRTEVWVYASNNINASDLVKDIQGKGNRRSAKLEIDKDIEAAQEFLLDKIQKKLDIINSA
ncbi:hypothetical protein KKH39_02135 [Patescibacteria group bacterium]|nr:hypothetical protein [Patescibacteria group bacterium]